MENYTLFLGICKLFPGDWKKEFDTPEPLSTGTDDVFRFKVDSSTKLSKYNSDQAWTQYYYALTTTGSHTLQWHYSKGASGTPSDGGAWIDYIEWIPEAGSSSPTLAEALDCSFTISTGGSANWSGDTSPWYYGGDVASSGGISNSQETWMQTTVTAAAGDKVSFYWKVSSQSGDYLKFYIDGQYQTGISGEVDWQKKSYSLSAGSRTLKWVYSKDSSGLAGDDCGWVDFVQDPNHTNPFMFANRCYDIKISLLGGYWPDILLPDAE